jgi:hypothetical protein
MSTALTRELDLKMQQVREYGLIAHGYHNENIQFPVHVRRSHDGEKVSPTTSVVPNFDNHRRKTRLTSPTILTPSSHENRTKMKAKELSMRQSSYDEHYTTSVVPPNKTINDINPSLNRDRFHSERKSSSSSVNSSPILCSSRPYSIAGLSLSTRTSTEEQQITSLSNSSQSLLNQSTKTLTKRFFSKLFHPTSKS